jgi:hypothetical protein
LRSELLDNPIAQIRTTIARFPAPQRRRRPAGSLDRRFLNVEAESIRMPSIARRRLPSILATTCPIPVCSDARIGRCNRLLAWRFASVYGGRFCVDRVRRCREYDVCRGLCRAVDGAVPLSSVG